MCTAIFAFKAHPNYDLIFLGNRDEYRSRAFLRSHYWESNSHILAGIDLQKGGTWTGITKEGRLAFVTNYRDPSRLIDAPLSRGYLPRDYLTGELPPLEYLNKVRLQSKEYNPFNLVVGNRTELWFYSNVEQKIIPIPPGIHGLSNCLLNTPWFKVTKGKQRLALLLNTDFSKEQLFEILDDTEVPPDRYLPKTGVSLETERMLAPIHIDTPNYGTLIKTLILVSAQGKIDYYEKVLGEGNQWELATFTN